MNESIDRIKPTEWILDLICPKCKRPNSVSSIIHREGTRFYKKVTLPTFCIWCEEMKEDE